MTLTRSMFSALLSLILLPGLSAAQAQATTAAPNAAPTTLLTQQQKAAQAAAEARDLIARARDAYPPGSANIDQPLWKQAAEAAEAAVAAAPGNPDYLRLRAQIYTEVGFWHLAEMSWAAYFRAAPADASAIRQAADVQYNLGYAAYTRNQPDQAASFFRKCLELDPQSVNCTAWSARTALEAGNYTLAQQLYAQALALKPKDANLVYFRALALSAGKYGPAATRSFSRAYEDLDAGRKTQALSGFQQAAQAAPNFVEAWREAGRLALELGDARAALDAYTGLSTLPNPSAADQYNLALAREGVQFGLEAVKSFRRGYASYLAGNRLGAENSFLDATTLNPDYAKAWAWLGRTRFESRNFQGATLAYARAVALDPNDKSSTYYLRLAQQMK